ncbi:MAG: outer membrane lipoprotein carrier protein LolA [Bacteroidales bacterium]|jgi:outer membrane lipoprotein-sorting protein|nr:outer membrane lipoprotein carrier protein LolA [Bacteroidales bacterium]
MRKIISFILLSLLLVINAEGQSDPKALSILDKFSSKASSAPSVSMTFLFVSNDQVQNSIDSVAGSVMLSKNSYKLDLPDNIIWFNGVTSWSYLPAEQEVTITEPDKKDNTFQSRPSMIFNMYKDGYKCRLLEEKTDSYLIDLYPVDLKNELIRVRLYISKPSLELKSFEYKMRSGVTYTLLVREYYLDKTPQPGSFEFAPEKYKGVEIIDMR